MMSIGIIASLPNMRKNGVNPLVDYSQVLYAMQVALR